MPTYQMIPVVDLQEPANPQRQETLYERIDELRDSLRTNGLQQPIGVTRQPDGHYQIVWGHRRSIAATQLGWSHIAAMVYEPGEADADRLMGAENYHRTQTNDKEEALYYQRIIGNYKEGTIGMARELNVPQKRIEDLLRLAQGDSRVFDLLGQKAISMAQAIEINKFESDGYRLQAIEYATKDGMSADRLRKWRMDVQHNQLDSAATQAETTWQTPARMEHDAPQAECDITNHMVPIMYRKVVNICNGHYNVILQGLELVGTYRLIEEVGLLPELMKLIHRAEILEGENGRTIRSEGDH